MKTTPMPAQTPRPPGGISGLHVIADLYGCATGPLMTDAKVLEELCLQYVREAGLFDVGRLFHAFPGDGGVTGTVVLAESHLSVHTWPENGYVSLDVFVCNYTADNTSKARNLAGRLMDLFAPGERRVQEVFR